MSGKDVSESTEKRMVLWFQESLWKGSWFRESRMSRGWRRTLRWQWAPAVTRARRRTGRPADQTQYSRYADRGIEQMHLQYLSIFKGESLSWLILSEVGEEPPNIFLELLTVIPLKYGTFIGTKKFKHSDFLKSRGSRRVSLMLLSGKFLE